MLMIISIITCSTTTNTINNNNDNNDNDDDDNSNNINMNIIIITLIMIIVIIIVIIMIIPGIHQGSSVKIGTIQRRLAWPLRKDDMHKSRNVNISTPPARMRQTDPPSNPAACREPFL